MSEHQFKVENGLAEYQKQASMPVQTNEVCKSEFSTPAAFVSFFVPRAKDRVAVAATTKLKTPPKDLPKSDDNVEDVVDLITPVKMPVEEEGCRSIYDVVVNSMKDTNFLLKFGGTVSSAPLPIMAVANYITTHKKYVSDWFPNHTMELTFPLHRDWGAKIDPHYHMIEGTTLIYVDWNLHFGSGIKIKCPILTEDGKLCNGLLKTDRSNWSKNKKLFPIFRLNSVPTWCIIQSYYCPTCGRRINGNDGRLLISLPEYIRNVYPVEPKFAHPTIMFHLDRPTSDLVEEILVTYGNGDQLSRMIYSKICKDYYRKIH